MTLPDRLPPHTAASQLPVPLNDSQRRAVLFCLLDVHRRLAEMESLLVQSQSASPLSQYVNDLSPTEVRVVRDYFDRLRGRLLSCLNEVGITPEVRHGSLRWGLQVSLTALDVAVAELEPKRLRGYGSLSDAGDSAIVKVREDVARLIDRVGAYLRQGIGRDLAQRLARLEASGATAATLGVLDRVITRRALVEFRPQLEMLVRRLEAPQFEVAVFGRVSSGKSSLLNHLVGQDVLPVGVTPVTAVPTRLVGGDEPAAVVSFAELPPRSIPVEILREYASEEGNPGNHKHVTGILVTLPAPRLPEGVVLVDTPGIGSLARSGSAETFAYLPRCDLGVVLIDAASTLTPDDLGLVRLLYEAAVPVQVLLSKADLVTAADRQRTADYVREQVRRELGLDLSAHPVSTVGADEALLTWWFAQEVEPLLARHRALVEASLRRKAAHLRESVVAALERLQARRRGGGSDGCARFDGEVVRRLLGEADEAVRRARQRCLDWTTDEPALLEIILRDAADAVVSSPAAPAVELVSSAVQRVLAARDQDAHGLAVGLQQTLGRTLEGLRRAAPQTPAEPAAIQDAAFRGLPVLDFSPLPVRPQVGRPWWTALRVRLAARVTCGRLRRQLGPLLRERVDLHDRQLQAWLRSSLGQLVELYEAQAEVFREQAVRLSDGKMDADFRELEADLRALREADSTSGAAGPAGTEQGTGA